MATVNKCIDRLGQEVNVGDWCAITQHNEVYVGKVIKAGNSVTIARDRIEGEVINKGYKRNWKQYQNELKELQKIFPSLTYIPTPLSFVRDNKFIKITPTRDMELKYENV